MIKNFYEFTNEGVRDKMTPKSEEDIRSAINQTINDYNEGQLSKYPTEDYPDFQHIANLFDEPMEKLHIIGQIDDKWEIIDEYLSNLVEFDDNYITVDEVKDEPIGGK